MFETFVINLDRDQDRMKYMDQQLSALSIGYRRQSAVLGKGYQPTLEEYDPELAEKCGGRALLPGEVGCALSHRKVMETVVKEQIPFALILEDDVALPPGFKEVVEQEIARQPYFNWEYLLFDYAPVGLPFIRQWYRGASKTVVIRFKQSSTQALILMLYTLLKACYIVPLSIFEGIRDRLRRYYPGPVRFYRPVYYAGAYMVSLDGAKKLHSLSTPVVYTADQLPNRARILKKLSFRVYAPRSVTQLRTTFGSSILDLSADEVKRLVL